MISEVVSKDVKLAPIEVAISLLTKETAVVKILVRDAASVEELSNKYVGSRLCVDSVGSSGILVVSVVTNPSKLVSVDMVVRADMIGVIRLSRTLSVDIDISNVVDPIPVDTNVSVGNSNSVDILEARVSKDEEISDDVARGKFRDELVKSVNSELIDTVVDSRSVEMSVLSSVNSVDTTSMLDESNISVASGDGIVNDNEVVNDGTISVSEDENRSAELVEKANVGLTTDVDKVSKVELKSVPVAVGRMVSIVNVENETLAVIDSKVDNAESILT